MWVACWSCSPFFSSVTAASNVSPGSAPSQNMTRFASVRHTPCRQSSSLSSCGRACSKVCAAHGDSTSHDAAGLQDTVRRPMQYHNVAQPLAQLLNELASAPPRCAESPCSRRRAPRRPPAAAMGTERLAPRRQPADLVRSWRQLRWGRDTRPPLGVCCALHIATVRLKDGLAVRLPAGAARRRGVAAWQYCAGPTNHVLNRRRRRAAELPPHARVRVCGVP